MRVCRRSLHFPWAQLAPKQLSSFKTPPALPFSHTTKMLAIFWSQETELRLTAERFPAGCTCAHLYCAESAPCDISFEAWHNFPGAPHERALHKLRSYMIRKSSFVLVPGIFLRRR
jgi:hypothetical protein